MKLTTLPLLAILICACANTKEAETVPALTATPVSELYAPHFKIGAALNTDIPSGKDSIANLVTARHFNSIVAENCMKSEAIHPQKDVYFWDDADKLVEFGEKNGQQIVGHCLIWHSQLAPWFCVDDKGELVSSEELKERMRDHIHTIVGRYKGRVDAWDVVNETIEDDGSYRNSQFYQILGEEYIPLAFQYAHEADPDAMLIINDYSMSNPAKRDRYVQIVNDLKSRGLRVDAIGIQGHSGMDYPDFAELEKSINAFAATGCEVMVTELDMSALPNPFATSAAVENRSEYSEDMNPYPDGLTPEANKAWNDRMTELMKLLIRNSDKISRVNFWGVNDKDSWLNDWPIPGRTNYPLMFDREWNVKPFVEEALK